MRSHRGTELLPEDCRSGGAREVGASAPGVVDVVAATAVAVIVAAVVSPTTVRVVGGVCVKGNVEVLVSSSVVPV